MKANSLLACLTCCFSVTCCLAQPQAGTVLWSHPASPLTTPALGPDGTVYIAYAGVTAITNNGITASIKWSFPISAYQITGIAIAADGTIYAANTSSSFYAIRPDGTERWSYTFGYYGSSPPAIGWDGTIYVVGDGSVNALSPAGLKKWSYNIWAQRGTLAVASDGTIYARNDQSPAALYALSTAGNLKWSVEVPSGSVYEGDAPAIGSEGVVYIGGDSLNAFSPAGTKLWSSTSLASFGLVVGQDGTVYANRGNDATLYAIRPDGTEKWHLDFPYRCQWHACTAPTTPAIDSAGNLYYTASNALFSISAAGQVLWCFPLPGFASGVTATTSTIIGPDGTIYACLSNALYAVIGSNPPANSYWPMSQQNARHTGKVEAPALKNFQRRSDANFQFQLYAQLGQSNAVEATTNLSTWSFLTSVVVTNVPMDVVDLTASNAPSRFYRAIAP